MEKIIVTTPEELRALIFEAVNSNRENKVKQNAQAASEVSDNLTLEGAVSFLQENGFPTSKGTLYKLTSSKEIPFRKYGIKLVFSRKALLEWAMSSTINFDEDGTSDVIRHAKRKSKL